MIIKSIIGTTCTCLAVVSFNTSAALIERLGGLAYYDDVSGLTWLTDANAAKTSGYDADGLMNWTDANNWAAGLNISGVSGWRLASSDTCYEYNCTGSEMGNLFYNVLGNTTSLTNTGPFSNIRLGNYWTATEYAPDTNYAEVIHLYNGRQSIAGKISGYSSWAVHTGDVSAVPVPAAVWLFCSGLFGLIGIAKRKKA